MTRVRRKSDWNLGVGGTGLTQLTVGSAAILGAGVTPTTSEATLARTRGFVEMILEAATASGDGFQGAIGIGKTTVAAFAIGVTAVPTPLTEMAWDGWLYHRHFCLHAPGADAVLQANLRFELDSKAMRKIEVEEVFYAAIEVVEIGGAVLDVFLDIRMLVLLP